MEHAPNSTALFRRGLGVLGLVLSLAVAIASYRYLVPGIPMPDLVGDNLFRLPWLVVHAASASTALLVGPWQFWSKLRARAPRLHRWMGRCYAVACLLGGASGLVLALGASTGLVSTTGFGLLAIAWLYTTANGWRTALRREFIAHRRWMIRSFALTFAAVTLRIYLPASMALPFDIDDSYRAISFLCWVPNLLAAEWYLRRQPQGQKAWSKATSPGTAT